MHAQAHERVVKARLAADGTESESERLVHEAQELNDFADVRRSRYVHALGEAVDAFAEDFMTSRAEVMSDSCVAHKSNASFPIGAINAVDRVWEHTHTQVPDIDILVAVSTYTACAIESGLRPTSILNDFKLSSMAAINVPSRYICDNAELQAIDVTVHRSHTIASFQMFLSFVLHHQPRISFCFLH